MRWSRDPVTVITTPPGIEVRCVKYFLEEEGEGGIGREKREEEEEEEERVNDD